MSLFLLVILASFHSMEMRCCIRRFAWQAASWEKTSRSAHQLRPLVPSARRYYTSQDNAPGVFGVFRILAPTAILGYGFPKASFDAALDQARFDLIAVDAGSIDPGPYYLASRSSFTSLEHVLRDLQIIVEGMGGQIGGRLSWWLRHEQSGPDTRRCFAANDGAPPARSNPRYNHQLLGRIDIGAFSLSILRLVQGFQRLETSETQGAIHRIAQASSFVLRLPPCPHWSGEILDLGILEGRSLTPLGPMPKISKETLAESNSVALHVLHCFLPLIVSFPKLQGAK